MSIDKLKTKFFTGAWLTDVKHYFTKINEIIDYSKTLKYNKPLKEEGWFGLRTESIHKDNYKLFNSITFISFFIILFYHSH